MHSIFILILLLVACSWGSEIVTDLVEMQDSNFTIREEVPINVTVGEPFSISLPQFDFESLKEFTTYELSQEKFISLFETMEKHGGSPKEESRKKISNSIFDCNIQLPSMEVFKTFDILTQKSPNRFNFDSEEDVIYVPIKSRGLLYTLDTSTMAISVYHFTPKKLNFLSSAKVSYQDLGKDQRVAMASDSSQEKVYVVSSQGMWSIQTKTVLTKVEKITELNGFRSESQPIDKLYHGSYSFLYGLRRHMSVFLIPESEGRSMIEITHYGKERIFPQDLYIDGRMLYVLDTNKGIYIYTIMGNGEVQEFDHISTITYGNKEIIVKEASIFVKFVDQQGHKIIELSYESETKTASLVRYYKLDEVILSMSIQAVSVASHGGRVFPQLLLFLVGDNGQIEAYPYNIDPRTINSVHNGVKMHVEGANKLIYLYEDMYVIVTTEGLVYAQITINLPKLVCHLPESTGHVYYEFELSTDISTCEQYDRSLAHKKLYNSNCRIKSTYGIFVYDPELSKLQKAILYSVVVAVVIGFIVGLMCLITWRNNKLSLIGRIKDEIVRFRDRHRKMQPFVEEEPQKNKGVVEFELPDIVEPVPARE